MGGNLGVMKKSGKKGKQKESFELTTRLAWWGIEHRRHGWIRIKGLSVCVCVCVCVWKWPPSCEKPAVSLGFRAEQSCIADQL